MFILLMFLLWLLAAIYVADDASKRGKSGLLWFFIVLLTGVLGLLIWLIVRPPLVVTGQYSTQLITSQAKQQTPAIICQKCGRSIPYDANVCPYCGNIIRKI